MIKINSVRLTLASLIFAIESDLRLMIQKYIIPFHTNLDFLINPELIEKVGYRFKKDNVGINIDDNLDEIVAYLDFQETFEIILANKATVKESVYEEIKKYYKSLTEITPIRNRVMHTRPLEYGDFSKIIGFVSEIEIFKNEFWQTTTSTKSEIDNDPNYVFHANYLFDKNSNKISHNLPLPDFDETGFIGRKKDVSDVKNLILGNNRVLSILGDGGIGKTALILKVAYDIIDLPSCPFDMVIWLTAKTSRLTEKGIEEIYDSIKDFSGIINSIDKQMENSTKNIESKMEDILNYMDVFKILLIIDNLETILDDKLRIFIREAQTKCKIALTSRIGLGELEFPKKLEGLNEIESKNLILQIANVRNSKIILRLTSETLKVITQKLHYNPLALKWFVNSVESGIPPSKVLDSKEDLLTFCLSNVYNKLSVPAKTIIDTIIASRKSLTYSEIIYLTELEDLILKKTINELFTTTIISREVKIVNDSQEIVYVITDFAKEYLTKNFPITKEFIIKISLKIYELNKKIPLLKEIDSKTEFKVQTLSFTTTDEKIAALKLQEALIHSKKEEYEKALNLTEEAKKIAPDYFECYRVSAFIKANSEKLVSAEEDYEIALTLNPESPKVLLYYGQFLLYILENNVKAMDIALKLNQIKPNSPIPISFLARCYQISGMYVESLETINKGLQIEGLTNLNLRMLRTTLIDTNLHYSNSLKTNEGNYSKAIELLKENFIVFDESFKEDNFDPTLVKSFAQSVYAFLKTLPNYYVDQEKVFIAEFIKKYKNLIESAYLSTKIFTILNDKFNISFEDSTTEIKEIHEGKMFDIKKQKMFGFLKSGSNIFYTHKKYFRNESEWFQLKTNDNVEFIIGKNEKGPCAINVSLIQKRSKNN